MWDIQSSKGRLVMLVFMYHVSSSLNLNDILCFRLCTVSGEPFKVPGPNKLFGNIYNEGKGAKITNGSWSSPFRPYSTRCRLYDNYLREQYDEILFVSSAGNAGNDVPGKVTSTIGEPASCKNILAVGASQSHGERIYSGDMGIDYLADFSSRVSNL